MTAPATILIVDDERANCRLLEALLLPEGYRPVSVGSGEDALEAVAASPPDLILLDVRMPGMDGLQVARILKGDPATSHIPIIMVSAQHDRADRICGLDAGAEDYLAKPVDRSELWLRVRNLLRLKEFSDFLRDHAALLDRDVRARTADLQRFRTAMDATAEAIFLVDRASMRYEELNKTACTLLGYSRQELLDMAPPQLGMRSMAELMDDYDGLIASHPRHQLSEEAVLHKNGTRITVEVQRHAQRSGDVWLIVEVLRDITTRREIERRLEYLAHYDGLTGLANRTYFHHTLEQTIALAEDNRSAVALVFIDLDHFKTVNDTLGHDAGDKLLSLVSRRLVGCISLGDTIARLGGDEFGLILPLATGDVDRPVVVARSIRDALREPFAFDDHEVLVTASIGIALEPDDARDAGTLVKYADTAMYRAKHAGRDTHRFFTAQMNEDLLQKVQTERALRKAMRNGEFVLHYQPKVRLDDGAVSGVEALLRWECPGRGLVAPLDFIPLLEETGLILDVGRWVIHEACEQVATWLASPIGPMAVSVNVSPRQFSEGDLGADVVHALRASGIPPHLLELELTETSLMTDSERTVATLTRLRELGVAVSIDDFGTGYSSLAYLRQFPVNKLKIDIAFVREITSSDQDAAMVLAIIRMAQSLQLETVAEGVETVGQLAFLSVHGCDEIQGFHFSRPLPLAGVEKLLRDGRRLPARVAEVVMAPPELTVVAGSLG